MSRGFIKEGDQEEFPMVNGELGLYGMMNTALFIDLMNAEEERRSQA